MVRGKNHEQDHSGATTPRCVICGNGTRQGKPHCPDHISEHPYVRWLMDVVEDRELEMKIVARAGVDYLDFDSTVLHEIVFTIRDRPMTVATLASETQIRPSSVLWRYINFLKAHKVVSVSKKNGSQSFIRLLRMPEFNIPEYV